MPLRPHFYPGGPPDRVILQGRRSVRFWFIAGSWTAVYGFTRVELHEHRIMYPEAPFALEPFIYYPDGRLKHYGGKRFLAPPSEDEFVERTFQLLELLSCRDGIDEGHGDWD